MFLFSFNLGSIWLVSSLNLGLCSQAVGYNSIEAEDWELATSGEEMSKLETLLLDKNRKMEHELTQLKVCNEIMNTNYLWSLFYGL